jgi:hypothetical protein
LSFFVFLFSSSSLVRRYMSEGMWLRLPSLVIGCARVVLYVVLGYKIETNSVCSAQNPFPFFFVVSLSHLVIFLTQVVVVVVAVPMIVFFFFCLCNAQGWSVVAKMTSARDGHTATLLPDGSVLLCGGGNSLGHPATCDFFQSGVISGGPIMISAHYYGTATFIPGLVSVLICGGEDANWAVTNQCELYNVKTKAFVTTDFMSTKRYQHTATLISQTDVLLCGGGDKSCEIFYSVSGTFGPVINMTQIRSTFVASLLSGSSDVLLCGGGANTGCDRFYFSTKVINATANMTEYRYDFASVEMADMRVILCGGAAAGSDLTSCDVYDPVLKTISSAGQLAYPRSNHQGVFLQGINAPLFCGGNTNALFCDLYNSTTAKFARVYPLNFPRVSGFTMTNLADRNVLICGGMSSAAVVENRCELLSNVCYKFGFQLPQKICGNVASLSGQEGPNSGPGSWSVIPSSAGIFSNANSNSSSFTSSIYNVPVTLIWLSSTNCVVQNSVTFVSNPTARVLVPFIVGCGVSANVSVELSGDAVDGMWNGFLPGSVSSGSSSSTSFSWASSQVGQNVPLTFSPASVCASVVVVTVQVPTSGSCCAITLPSYGCVSQSIPITAASMSSGAWSSNRTTDDGSFGNADQPKTTFTAAKNGTFLLSYSSVTCNKSGVIVIVSPPLAFIPPLLKPACGGSVFLGAFLTGDAVVGQWSLASSQSSGSFVNPTAAFTLFTWTISGERCHSLYFSSKFLGRPCGGRVFADVISDL